MEDNQMLVIIKDLLKKEKIEMLNIANEKENGCLLSFLYKGYKTYITNDGMLYIDDKLNAEDQNYIKKIIAYAQTKANIDKFLPILNIDIEKLELRTINNLSYRQIMMIKNQCLFYRENGIFGIQYLLCEQVKHGQGYAYKNISIYHNIRVAEQNYANRTQLMIKPLNLFNNEELKTILFYIDTFKSDKKSKNLKNTTENIKKIIIEILKGDESEHRT